MEKLEMERKGNVDSARFPILFDSWYRMLSSLLFMPPSTAYVLVEADEIIVRMSWAFCAQFPRSAVASTSEPDSLTISRGVHGFRGRWLVNGSGRGILQLNLIPEQRAHVMGLPVRLKALLVSVAEPAALVNAVS
jgi:hypothetical protein